MVREILYHKTRLRSYPCVMKHYRAVVYTALVSYHFVSLYYGSHFNSLGSDRCGNTFKGIIFKHIIHNCSSGTRCEFALSWMSQNATDDMSTLVRVMAWWWANADPYLCRHVTSLSHYELNLVPEGFIYWHSVFQVCNNAWIRWKGTITVVLTCPPGWHFPSLTQHTSSQVAGQTIDHQVVRLWVTATGRGKCFDQQKGVNHIFMETLSMCLWFKTLTRCRGYSGYGLNQWEEVLLCNTFCHWPNPFQKWSCDYGKTMKN